MEVIAGFTELSDDELAAFIADRGLAMDLADIQFCRAYFAEEGLEQVQPVLFHAVHIHLALDGAGVDLLGLVEAGENALLLQPLRADGAHVHEAHGLLVAAQLVALAMAFERPADVEVIDGFTEFSDDELATCTSGRSPWLMSCMHSLAESARWSNWPGRNSTANTAAPLASGSSKVAMSDCGSENTVVIAAWPWTWPTSSSAAPTLPRRGATRPSPRSR